MNTGTPRGDWTLEVDGDGIAWLTLDVLDAAVNSLSRAVLAGLDVQLAEIERRRPLGVAVTSAKNGLRTSETSRPMAWVRVSRSDRACALGR